MSYLPTPHDVERYRRLRAASLQLNSKLTKALPKPAFEEVATALDLMRNGVLVLNSEDESGVLADCCIHNWYKEGRNVAQQFFDAGPVLNPAETELLQAYQRTVFRILRTTAAFSGAGVRCLDLLNGGEIFLMDIGLSQFAPGGDMAVVTRTVPIGDFWMTTGAALPTMPHDVRAEDICELARGTTAPANGAGGPALAVIRLCLSAGAASNVRYEDPVVEGRRKHKGPSTKLGRRWRK